MPIFLGCAQPCASIDLVATGMPICLRMGEESGKFHAPEPHPSWWPWLATALFLLWQVDFQFVYGFVAEEIQQELALSAGQATAIAAIFLVSYGAMQVPAGMLLDRFGLRAVLPAATILGVASVAAFASANTFLELAATRLLAGTAVAFAFPAAGKIARVTLRPGAFALAMALADMCFGLGAVLASITSEALAELSWRANLHWLALAGGVITTHLIFVLFRTPLRDATETPASRRPGLRTLLGVPEVRAACLLYAWGAGMAFGFGGYWNLQLQAECGCTAPQVSHLSTALFAGLAAGMAVAGALASSAARWRLLLRAGTTATIALLATILVVSPHANEAVMIPLLAIFGIGLGPSALAFPWATSRLPADHAATVVGLVNATGCLAGALAEALPIWIDGGHPLHFAVPSVYLGLAALGLVVAWRLPPQPIAPPSAEA